MLLDGIYPSGVTLPSIGQQLSAIVALFLGVLFAWKKYNQRQIEERFVSEHSCRPLRPWHSKWPLGLDMLARIVKAAREERLLQLFVQEIDLAGTTYEQNLLGGRAIGTVDPRNIEAILSTNFNDYGLGLRAPTFRPLLGSGIFTQDGDEWKHSRQLLRPQFTYNRYQNFEQIKKAVQELIQAIPEDGVVDLQPLCFKLTFDTTMFLLFGDSVSTSDWGQVAGQESEFAKAFTLAQDYLAYRGRIGQFYWLLSGREFRDACKACHRFVDEAISKALKSSKENRNDKESDSPEFQKKSYVFVEALVQQTSDIRVIRDQCLNLLLAGRDTTGCCLTWTIRLLARHQHVLDRLRGEIEQAFGFGDDAPEPTMEGLKTLTYLNIVIKEVLRLYPSVPVNSREAIRLTTLPVGGGPDGQSPILVRPGEGVGYSVYIMHRRKDIYGEDAEEFRPERWEGDALKDVGWAYLPFNDGPRRCLGQDFALLEVAYTIARVVQVFPNIKVPDTEPEVKVGSEKQRLTLVVASAEGCVVSMQR